MVTFRRSDLESTRKRGRNDDHMSKILQTLIAATEMDIAAELVCE